jgi:hypothetical protein
MQPQVPDFWQTPVQHCAEKPKNVQGLVPSTQQMASLQTLPAQHGLSVWLHATALVAGAQQTPSCAKKKLGSKHARFAVHFRQLPAHPS